MSSQLMMDSGISGKTKAMILGGVVVVFALVAGTLMHSGKTAAAKAKPAAVQSARVKPSVPAAVPTDMTATADAPQTATAAPAPAEAMNAQPPPAAAASPASPYTQVAAAAPPPPAPAAASEPKAAGDWNTTPAGEEVASDDTAAQASVSPPRPAVRPPPPPALDALQPWWQDTARRQGFDVQYVGQAASEKALVFRFSKSIADAQMAAKHIRVTNDKGDAATGIWAAGNNPYVLVYQGVSAGRYTVSIDPALPSADGATLGAPLQGPVYVN